MSEVRNNEMQILIDIIKAFDPDKFIRFFRDKNRSFAPRKEELTQYNDENFKSGIKLGEIQFAQKENPPLPPFSKGGMGGFGDEKMLICLFQASQPLSERSSKKAQYEKGKKILKDSQSDAGIFIFHDSNNNFRFSLIYAEYLGVRRRFSYFKRLTFFVSPRLTNKTFLQQIGECDFFSFENIKEAFSVEPVTKQFYGELQYWYFWAMDKIKFPDDYKYSNDPAKDKEIRNATNLIRLITRIIFIRFLTEKGLIPSELFSGEKLGRIVKDFMKGRKTANFYNAILQNLFFGTLNQKMDERSFADERGYPANMKEYGVKNLYRYGDKFLFSKDEVLKLFKDIPFLNGGLFDCLDKENGAGKVIYVDGFSRNPAKQSNIPDYLFFQQEEERADLSNYGLGASRPVRGLIEILNSYNFTIDENTPVDQEIALDPELLGKVFENLLASYNPETATTARKATGSYYTPREIVDYMVEESLVVYLANAINNAPQPPLKLREGERGVMLPCPIAGEASHNIPSPLVGEGKGEGWRHSRLHQLLSYSEEIPEISAPERKKIISAIDDIKILDPACGSGAFPMGILHKLVYALQKLDPENKYWHELQYQKALKESEEVFKQDDKNERQERLEEINEAFDEGINYPDYARKLYLIENCIYGVDIQPIAIQISKLRFFISLVLDQKVDRGKENLGIRALPNLETKFVAANTLIGLDKPEQLLLRNIELTKKEAELKQIRHKYFEAKTRKEKLDYQKKDSEIRKEIADLLKHSGWDSSTAEKIATFDLYDQNASADFFDPEWMFGIKNPSPSAGAPLHNTPSPLVGEGRGEGGFDIVIGNPPYVRVQNLSHDIIDLYKQLWSTAWKRIDISTLFMEFAMSVCNRKGTAAFISSNQFLTTEYGHKTREYFLKKAGFVRILDFADLPVFENTITYVSVFFMRPKPMDKFRYTRIVELPFNPWNLSWESIDTADLDSENWVIGDSDEKRLINKMISESTPLGELAKCWAGLITGMDALLLFNEHDERLSLIEKELLMPVLRAQSCERYCLAKPTRYTIYPYKEVDGKTMLISENELKRKFPRAYSYLIKYKNDLAARKDSRSTMGEKSAWYGLVRFGRRSVFKREKIVSPGEVKQNKFALDMTGSAFSCARVFAITAESKKLSLRYLLGLLNSRLLEFYLHKTAPLKQGGYYSYSAGVLDSIPIKVDNKTHVFEALVNQILVAKQKDPNADTSALEREIDKMVYELYGLTDEEIKIVEGIK